MHSAHTGVMNALEVMETLRALDVVFHGYIPWHYTDTDDDWDWRCKRCGLPPMNTFHSGGTIRPWWFSAYQFAAQSEIDDRLLEWKLDRAAQAVLDSAVDVINCGGLQ